MTSFVAATLLARLRGNSTRKCIQPSGPQPVARPSALSCHPYRLHRLYITQSRRHFAGANVHELGLTGECLEVDLESVVCHGRA